MLDAEGQVLTEENMRVLEEASSSCNRHGQLEWDFVDFVSMCRINVDSFTKIEVYRHPGLSPNLRVSERLGVVCLCC